MLVTALILAASLKAQTLAPTGRGAPTVVVDLSRPLRQVTRCATGAHWGLSATAPPLDLLTPLRPTVFRQPATLGPENAGLGALDVRTRAQALGVHHIEAVLADLLPGYPYEWSGKDEWQRLVRLFAQHKVAAGADDVWYDLWNEPDWRPPAAWAQDGGYPAFWKGTFDLLREADPQAVIVGPSYSAWSRETFRETLTFMRDHACLPDVVSWHELTGAAGIEGHVLEYRALERELGIDERPLSINEYMSKDTLGVPALIVAHLARLERAHVGYACLAYYQDPASLGRLLEKGSPLGGYWVFRWYAEMTGEMVNVTPGAASDLPDAVASLDPARETARILVAGDAPRLTLYGFGAAPGLIRDGRVRVRIERAPHAGFRPVAAPALVEERDVEIREHAVEISMPVSGWDAVLVTLSAPTSARPAVVRRRAPAVRQGGTAGAGTRSGAGPAIRTRGPR